MISYDSSCPVVFQSHVHNTQRLLSLSVTCYRITNITWRLTFILLILSLLSISHFLLHVRLLVYTSMSPVTKIEVFKFSGKNHFLVNWISWCTCHRPICLSFPSLPTSVLHLSSLLRDCLHFPTDDQVRVEYSIELKSKTECCWQGATVGCSREMESLPFLLFYFYHNRHDLSVAW